MIVPPWFLYISGFSLVLLGVLQIQARPRQPDDTLYTRFVNIGTLWSLCCIAAGLAILSMALGYWTPTFLIPPKKPPKLHPH